ncbi:FAD-dependent oxidoreductase [Sphaerisporangium sp. NPDC051011]|uniref:FAD-binding oxidoreductase n=1 Tax=Sphaerisporangium sp. NPDC051011 TaxID=3155792 RepID=UPI00340725FA
MTCDIPLRTLAEGFAGEVILPGDDGYESARRVWNRSIDRRPAVVARCRTADDARSALAVARDAGLEIAVRGGGHSFPGFSTTEGGLVLDLGPMKRIVVDPASRTAKVGPGVRWGELTTAAARYGLAPVGGHVADVGTYLCGTGGMHYLDPSAFRNHSIEILPFQAPTSGIWMRARELSALHALMLVGPHVVQQELAALRARVREGIPLQ